MQTREEQGPELESLSRDAGPAHRARAGFAPWVRRVALAAGLATPLAVLAAPGLASASPALTGTYILRAADTRGHDSVDVLLQGLKVGDTFYTLHSTEPLPFETGERIVVSGTVSGSDVAVSSATAKRSAEVRTMAASTSTNTDTMHLLVMLVQWKGRDSVTRVAAGHQVGTGADAWFRLASYGLQRIVADATPWLTIADPLRSSCDVDQLASEADQAAAARGYDLSTYDHFMYYFPADYSTCQWGGLADVGGSTTWINGEMNARVTIHELGHNLGLMHSHSHGCEDGNGRLVPLSGSCEISSEYGDPFSAMGAGDKGQGVFTANMLASLGWLGQGAHRYATLVSSDSQTITLTPIEEQGGGIQAVQVVDPNGLSPDLWLEYRQPAGNDKWIRSGGSGGVLIHAYSGTDSNLLDMRAGRGGYTDAVLPFGASWTNPLNGMTLHVGTGTSARVNVTVN